MNDALFATVDDYIEGLFVGEDPVLAASLADAAGAGLPAIQVSPAQGSLLRLLALLIGARRILEIGTLGGYSAIWLARALPREGRLITLERDPHHAEVARANLARAGFADRVEVRVGPAAESLAALLAEGGEPFDLVFIDADKAAYADYLDWALRLTRSGGLIIADNVLRRAAISVPEADTAAADGIRRFNARLAADLRLTATILPTVGRKGFDGLALARVR
jgi:predicted O-methyltransferase YrrM